MQPRLLTRHVASPLSQVRSMEEEMSHLRSLAKSSKPIRSPQDRARDQARLHPTPTQAPSGGIFLLFSFATQTTCLREHTSPSLLLCSKTFLHCISTSSFFIHAHRIRFRARFDLFRIGLQGSHHPVASWRVRSASVVGIHAGSSNNLDPQAARSVRGIHAGRSSCLKQPGSKSVD